MLSAHTQAWIWQDEWVGLTMDVSTNVSFINLLKKKKLNLLCKLKYF